MHFRLCVTQLIKKALNGIIYVMEGAMFKMIIFMVAAAWIKEMNEIGKVTGREKEGVNPKIGKVQRCDEG